MDKILVRGPFAYDVDLVSQDSGLRCLDDSLTVQSDKDDADINTLVRRFGITGTMPQLERLPINEDFVPIVDYHSALNQLRAADEDFMRLPADVRARFNHDAGAFVSFCSDSANLPELRSLGLAPPAVVEEVPVVVPPVVPVVPGA